jgi:hypothetical protein
MFYYQDMENKPMTQKQQYAVQNVPNAPVGRMTKTAAERIARQMREANRQAGNPARVRVVPVA